MKNAINWFAIPSTDFKRAVKFYNEIFGFELNVTKMGEDDLAFFPVIRRSRRITSISAKILLLQKTDRYFILTAVMICRMF
ncbi:MAG: VOC family protein [Ignavibacteria bacterium]